jgi:GNAT superfamily N-acetyltransferase
LSDAAQFVRRRLADDLTGCVRALRAVHTADGYPTWWPVDPTGWLTPPGLVDAWVAERAGVVVGHLCVVRSVPDPLVASHAGVPTDRLAEVSRLFVAPEARGQDLGAALLATASSWAAAHSLQLMLDVVDDSGPAPALYERLGWLLVDRRPAAWTTPTGLRPSIRIYRAPTAGASRPS